MFDIILRQEEPVKGKRRVLFSLKSIDSFLKKAREEQDKVKGTSMPYVGLSTLVIHEICAALNEYMSRHFNNNGSQESDLFIIKKKSVKTLKELSRSTNERANNLGWVEVAVPVAKLILNKENFELKIKPNHKIYPDDIWGIYALSNINKFYYYPNSNKEEYLKKLQALEREKSLRNNDDSLHKSFLIELRRCATITWNDYKTLSAQAYVDAKAYNINEQDKYGNTLLHVVARMAKKSRYPELLIALMRKLLDEGINPSIENKKGKIFLECFSYDIEKPITKRNRAFNSVKCLQPLFFLMQDYYPNVAGLNVLLQCFEYTGNINNFLLLARTGKIKINQFPRTSLVLLMQWIKNRIPKAHYQEIKLLEERLAARKEFLSTYPLLPEAIKRITSLRGEERTAMIRAVLINAGKENSLYKLLSLIDNEKLLLDDSLLTALNDFIKEYKQVNAFMEKYQGTLEPLSTEEERAYWVSYTKLAFVFDKKSPIYDSENDSLTSASETETETKEKEKQIIKVNYQHRFLAPSRKKYPSLPAKLRAQYEQQLI